MTERYEYGIDFDAVEAIDVHTHVEVDCHGHHAYDDELADANRSYFKMGDVAAATVDDVAADFPDLTIVMAHPAVPWIDAQIAIVAHKSNVYLDLSGYAPKYFPAPLVRALGRQLRTKALFGTDYPYVQMDRWQRDFAALDLDPESARLIFKDNARRMLGI